MRAAVRLAISIGLAGSISALGQAHPRMQGPTTSLASLVAEAQRNNSQVSTAEHAWRASTHLAAQATTLPDPQFTVQNLSVGSPKPWAGFSNSDFAYVGFGVMQDFPYPGKLRLRGVLFEMSVANERLETLSNADHGERDGSEARKALGSALVTSAGVPCRP